jgi:hypothetical protein
MGGRALKRAPIRENDQAAYRSWLESTGFRAASHPETWQAIKTNWIGFLSTSGGQGSALAPNRKRVQWSGGSATQQQRDARRFYGDR